MVTNRAPLPVSVSTTAHASTFIPTKKNSIFFPRRLASNCAYPRYKALSAVGVSKRQKKKSIPRFKSLTPFFCLIVVFQVNHKTTGATGTSLIMESHLLSSKFFSRFLHPWFTNIYGSNSDPESLCRVFSPFPNTVLVHSCIFIAKILNPFLPSSSRIEIPLPTPLQQALSEKNPSGCLL